MLFIFTYWVALADLALPSGRFFSVTPTHAQLLDGAPSHLSTNRCPPTEASAAVLASLEPWPQEETHHAQISLS